jgi:hypothetical protein
LSRISTAAAVFLLFAPGMWGSASSSCASKLGVGSGRGRGGE